MLSALPRWAVEMARAGDADVELPSSFPGTNMALNRARLAGFLAVFGDDRDFQDLLALDGAAQAAGLTVGCRADREEQAPLATRPFRVWEYCWLFQSLQLRAGAAKVLELSGPASHVSILAAIAGCRVTGLDMDPDAVRAAQAIARWFRLETLEARLGDMRDLSAFASGSFDAVVLCSVLPHFAVSDQEATMREVARVLRPGGLAGLTFDFGVPAADNGQPRSPHEPPADVAEVRRRYLQGGLLAAGNAFQEEPIAGSLFSDSSTPYNIASLILAKPPVPEVAVPSCEEYPRNAGSPVRQLPFLAHRWGRTRTDLLRDLQSERERWRLVSSERWRALEEKEAEIQRLCAELEARQKVIDDLLRRLGSGAISESSSAPSR